MHKKRYAIQLNSEGGEGGGSGGGENGQTNNNNKKKDGSIQDSNSVFHICSGCSPTPLPHCYTHYTHPLSTLVIQGINPDKSSPVVEVPPHVEGSGTFEQSAGHLLSIAVQQGHTEWVDERRPLLCYAPVWLCVCVCVCGVRACARVCVCVCVCLCVCVK